MSDNEINYVYTFLDGDNMVMTFGELPKRDQQIILDAEAKKK